MNQEKIESVRELFSTEAEKYAYNAGIATCETELAEALNECARLRDGWFLEKQEHDQTKSQLKSAIAQESDHMQMMAEIQAERNVFMAGNLQFMEDKIDMQRELEYLEKKLAEQQAWIESAFPFLPVNFQDNYPYVSEELTKREAAAHKEGFEEGEMQIALYKEDVERIWSLMPELRNTDSHFDIYEAVYEKLLMERRAGRDEVLKEQKMGGLQWFFSRPTYKKE